MDTQVTRRGFLRLSGLSAALAALAACNPLEKAVKTATGIETSLSAGPGSSLSFTPVAGDALRLHTLRRTTFGPTAEEIARAEAIGLNNWLEEQFSPEALDDSEVEARLGELETLEMSPPELLQLDDNGLVVRELVGATILRQVFSPRQLYEQMVDFWTNHFNIHAFAPPELYLKGQDDREVIRAHALGTFPDLLRASAHSPAMLVYLDNADSRYPEPNENYARELLELHSLGVDGGYTYNDIQAVARAFTGWSVGGLRRDRGNPGQFTYIEQFHDRDPKTVLGQALPGGKGDGDRVLEILAEHPSTAAFIAAKLCQRFVADDPPASIVASVAETYTKTGGDIPAMLRTIFTSVEFSASAGLKLKRPLDFVVSAVRVTGADGELDRILRFFLDVLGHVPFGWPAPDGYPDYAAAWSNTNQSLYRWNLAIVLNAQQMRAVWTEIPDRFGGASEPETLVDDLSRHLLGGVLPDDGRQILIDFLTGLSGADLPRDLSPAAVASGLILASPHFQIR